MAVTLTINGTSYSYPDGTDSEWGSTATIAMQQVSAPTNVIYQNNVTTKGDLLVATASGVVSRIGIGSNTQVLTADSTTSTGTKWATPNTTPEGTAVLSTGQGATKYLRADGDNSCSWQTPASGGKIAIQILIRGAAYVADGVAWARLPYAMTLASCRLGVSVAPTDASLTVDVRYHASDPTAPPVTVFNTEPSILTTAFSGQVQT